MNLGNNKKSLLISPLSIISPKYQLEPEIVSKEI